MQGSRSVAVLSSGRQGFTLIALLATWASVCTAAPAATFTVQEPAPSQMIHFLAFELRDGAQATPPAACLANYVRRSHPLYDRYRLLVLQHTGSVGALDLQRLTRCLGNDWVPIPLEQTPSMLRLPTDEILVRFKDTAQPKDIEALLRANDLTTNGIPGNNRRFMTARTHRPIAESLQIAKKLLTSALVEYAETNKILVRFER